MWVHFAAHLGSEPEMGCRGRYTRRKTRPAARSLPSAPPSPSACILLPPAARNRSRWWHRRASPAGRTSARPGTSDAAAIDVQQHPRQRPALAPLAMHSPLALPRHQSRSRQRQLDPGVTQPDSVLLHQFLVKVQHIQIEVLLPIELQHLLGQCHRNPPRRSLPPPLIKQPIVAKLLVAFPPPPHPAVADAYDLRRLPPSDPFRHRP